MKSILTLIATVFAVTAFAAEPAKTPVTPAPAAATPAPAPATTPIQPQGATTSTGAQAPSVPDSAEPAGSQVQFK